MEHLPSVIARMLSDRNLDQKDLAPLTGRTPTTVGAILKGQRCKPDMVESLMQNFAQNKKEQAEILYAHLSDECTRANSSFKTVGSILNLHDEEAVSAFLASGEKHVARMLRLSKLAQKDKALDSLLRNLDTIASRTENQPNLSPAELLKIQTLAKKPRLSPKIAFTELQKATPAALQVIANAISTNPKLKKNQRIKMYAQFCDAPEFLHVAEIASQYKGLSS